MSKCTVDFCRKECPQLEDGEEILRASGLVICPICGKDFYHHQEYAAGSGHVVKSCEGRFYHL